MLSKTLQLGAAGNAGGEKVYVDDVFSTFLYTGTGASHTIANGIDLSGEGGLVWIKQRNASIEHFLFDTERGATKSLSSNDTTSQYTSSTTLTGFGNTGFTLSSSNFVNGTTSAPRNYCSWTFRKAPGFFDCVTWTGNGVNGRQISHSLGSTPGVIIIKRLNSTTDWITWHRSLNSATKYLKLNTNDAEGTGATWMFNSTLPTSTHFTVANDGAVNGNTDTYVAYLFAHDDQSFGTDSDEAIIKCGSYTGAYPSTASVNLGFEPQWLLIKNVDTASDWILIDSMRGMAVDGAQRFFTPHTTNAEFVYSDGFVTITPTGFIAKSGSTAVNNAGDTIIYIAIRRPHKPPEAATDVFLPKAWTGTGSSHSYDAGFPLDLVWHTYRGGSSTATWFFDRLRGSNKRLISSSTGAEESAAFLDFDKQNSVGIDGNSSGFNASSENYIHHVFRRAPGFFDVVNYSTDSSSSSIPHNLGVTPELIITKDRGDTGSFLVYSATLGVNKYLLLNTDDGEGSASNFSAVSATHFSRPFAGQGDSYINYLFASVDGISKVGSYTGTGNNLSVNCGFAAGARFVLIKRTDSTGDWWVFDTARGIVSSGNDPALRLNLTNAEVTSTDYLEPNSNGFTVTSTAGAGLNANGGTYLYLAIA